MKFGLPIFLGILATTTVLGYTVPDTFTASAGGSITVEPEADGDFDVYYDDLVTPIATNVGSGAHYQYTITGLTVGTHNVQISQGGIRKTLITFTVVAPFDYVAASGKVIWLDMKDPASFTQSAGTMTGITNKASGVVWNTSAAFPTYEATGFNGFPCMKGNGTTQYIETTEAAVVALFTDAKAFTTYIVHQNGTVDITSNYLCAGSTAANTSRTRGFGLTATGSGRYCSRGQNDGATAFTQDGLLTPDTATHVIAYWTDSGATQISSAVDCSGPDIDDAAQVTGTNTPTRVRIFCRPDSGPDQFADGRIAEILMFNVVHTHSQRRDTSFALKAKWGFP